MSLKLKTAILDSYFSLSNTHSRIQELENNSEMKNLRKKVQAKISESTVVCVYEVNIGVFLILIVQNYSYKYKLLTEVLKKLHSKYLFFKQELSHDSIARLNCALPITKTISVIR